MGIVVWFWLVSLLAAIYVFVRRRWRPWQRDALWLSHLGAGIVIGWPSPLSMLLYGALCAIAAGWLIRDLRSARRRSPWPPPTVNHRTQRSW